MIGGAWSTMSVRAWRIVAQVLLAVAPSGVALAQAPLLEEVAALSGDVTPIERDFDIPQAGAGQYRLTVTDLGALLPDPDDAPLASVHVLVTRGTTVVASLDGSEDTDDEDDEDGPAVHTLTFAATPGTYRVHVVGRPGDKPGSGPISLRIANVATHTQVLDISGTLSSPGTIPETVRTYQAEVDIAAGDYVLTLADLEFPRAIETAGVLVFEAGASTLAACLSIPAVSQCPESQTVTLGAGRYQIVAAGAIPGNSDGGVFSVHIQGVAGGAIVHSRSVELGTVKRVSPARFRLDAGNYTLSLADVEFPVQLPEASALITHGAQVTALADATTPDAAFTVASNNTGFEVFAYVTPDEVAGTGSYIVNVRPEAGPAALSVVGTAGSASEGWATYTFAGDVPAAGSYRVRLGDFQFPAALGGAHVAVIQNGAVIGRTPQNNVATTLTLDLPTLAAGPVTVIVVAKSALAAGGAIQQAGGTFGLELVSASGTQTVLDVTQGVGGLISVRKLTILQPGHYDVTITDLDFPAVFQDLMAVISRGAQRLGTLIVGSGGANPQGGSAVLPDLDATAGNYSITLIARPGAQENAAAYALTVSPSPPGPTVTLSASPQSVRSGGTTTLTWSSQNATSCSATSSPAAAWGVTKATSGTETSAAITGSTTFTLRCVGAGGRSAEQSVTVNLETGNGSGGGGGSLGWAMVLCLGLYHAMRQGSRRRSRANRGFNGAR